MWLPYIDIVSKYMLRQTSYSRSCTEVVLLEEENIMLLSMYETRRRYLGLIPRSAVGEGEPETFHTVLWSER